MEGINLGLSLVTKHKENEALKKEIRELKRTIAELQERVECLMLQLGEDAATPIVRH